MCEEALTTLAFSGPVVGCKPDTQWLRDSKPATVAVDLVGPLDFAAAPNNAEGDS
jgi:hypothetical protein